MAKGACHEITKVPQTAKRRRAHAVNAIRLRFANGLGAVSSPLSSSGQPYDL